MDMKFIQGKVGRLVAISLIAGSSGIASAHGNWHAQVNRAYQWFDDGYGKNSYFTDNGLAEQQTLFGVDLTTTLDGGSYVGGQMEWSVPVNGSNVVTNGTTNASSNRVGNDVNLDDRFAEVWLGCDKWGRVTLGHGSMATDMTTQLTFSGLESVAGSDFAKWGSGMNFSLKNATAPGTSTQNVESAFLDYDGAGRQARVRYDSPEFAGFKLSGAVGNARDVDARDRYVTDLALRYNNDNLSNFKLAAALGGFKHSKGDSSKTFSGMSGSVAGMHVPSGANFTLAFGNQKPKEAVGTPSMKKRKAWFLQLAKKHDFMRHGATNFGLDFSKSQKVRQGAGGLDNTGKSMALSVSQELKKANSSVYVTYRTFKYSDKQVPARQYEKLNMVAAGVKVKFWGKWKD